MEKVNLTRIENTNILILLKTCQKMGIKYQLLDWDKYKFKLVKDCKEHIIWEKSMGLNSSLAISISRDKHKTYQILKKANLPVLPQIEVKNLAQYQEKGHLIPFPQVLKPTLGEKGQNIYLNIKNQKQGEETLIELLKKTQNVVVEPYFKGLDYRFIVLANKIIGLAQRQPPVITSDGKHNIRKLIKLENRQRFNLNKKVGRRMLNRILVWQRVKWYLKQQGLSFDDILLKDTKITLYPIPNFSTGGTVETVSLKNIHPSFIRLALKISQTIGLTLIGIDMLIKDINKPSTRENCAIIEVNSDPGLRLHDWPNAGEPQHVTEKILNFIFKS
ncbi:MAG TPA: hypothetical protein VMW41_04335 [Candidatus Bathyarchaeia archaeon]|nr:hypothetical protein [Candidatus Bathyarchaeia archaeon]